VYRSLVFIYQNYWLFKFKRLLVELISLVIMNIVYMVTIIPSGIKVEPLVHPFYMHKYIFF